MLIQFFSRLLGLALLLTLLWPSGGCQYYNEEDLYPVNTCDTTGVTYSLTITQILSQNCYECHSAAIHTEDIILEGYDNVKIYADNGALLGAIRHEAGYAPMPDNGPQLGACDISKIEKWIADGAPNN